MEKKKNDMAFDNSTIHRCFPAINILYHRSVHCRVSSTRGTLSILGWCSYWRWGQFHFVDHVWHVRMRQQCLANMMYIHVYLYTCVCMYEWMYVCKYIYIYTYIHIYTYTHIHIYTYTYIYTYIHIYIHIRTYIHIYICTYIHISIYTYGVLTSWNTWYGFIRSI